MLISFRSTLPNCQSKIKTSQGVSLLKNSVPLRVVVSKIMVVEKGDIIVQRVNSKDSGGGYARMESPADGIYINADVPILTLQEIEEAVKDLKKLKLRRQYEKDEELERKYREQTDRIGGEYFDAISDGKHNGKIQD